MGIIKKLLTKLYGVRMGLSKITGVGINIVSAKGHKGPSESFYDLSAKANNGIPISFKEYAGKKILLVNLASQCGYTPQYNELQKLQDDFKEKLIVLGFPSDDFGGQEPGSDEEIASFCQVNFGVTFQLFRKAEVIGPQMQGVYKWLADPSLNGWNSKEPTWNFCKYLVDERGQLLHFYSSSVSPLSDEVINSVLG